MIGRFFRPRVVAGVFLLLSIVGIYLSNAPSVTLSAAKRTADDDVAVPCDDRFRAGLQSIVQRSYLTTVDLSPYDQFNRLLHTVKFPETPNGSTAFMRKERSAMVMLARLPGVRTICEAGFNAGSSAALWLIANPETKLYAFDLWVGNTPAGEQFLRSSSAANEGIKRVNDRLYMNKGLTTKSIPAFAAAYPHVKCDIISIDAGHSYEDAHSDILNFQPLSSSRSVVIMDDTNCTASWCLGPHRAMLDEVKSGRLTYLVSEQEQTSTMPENGFTILQYTSIESECKANPHGS